MSAVTASVAFGLAAPFAQPLLTAGWSLGGAEAVRAAIGGARLLPLAIATQHRRYRQVWGARWHILAVASLGVAGSQLCFFSAIERIPVGTAILIHYTAPILLVIGTWILRCRQPAKVVLVGTGLATVGLILVVSPTGQALDPSGFLLAFGGAICLCVYFVVSANAPAHISSFMFASMSLVVDALLLTGLGAAGVVHLAVSTRDVAVTGTMVPWWVPVLVLGLVATAIAYSTSIGAARLLGSRLASFAGLLEIVTAAGFAWLLLDQSLTWAQAGGGLLVLADIGCVRADSTATRVSTTTAS